MTHKFLYVAFWKEDWKSDATLDLKDSFKYKHLENYNSLYFYRSGLVKPFLIWSSLKVGNASESTEIKPKQKQLSTFPNPCLFTKLC